MFISKGLSHIFHKSGATVLLYDGPDMKGRPRIVMRNVETIWGRYEPTGKKGGICFASLSDGSTHISYSEILGYHTGNEASIQSLLLKEPIWRKYKIPYDEWPDFIRMAAQALLNCRPPTNPHITADKLVTPIYWYNDNWCGERHDFVRLCDAKKNALTETGTAVSIYSYRTGQIVCIAPASGYCPP